MHEFIDGVEAKPLRTKIIGTLVFIGILIMIAVGLMYAGHRIGKSWADSSYLRESKKRDDQIAVLLSDAARHENNEKQLAAENSLLKKQNEALTEAQKLADTDRERKALADLAQREANRANQFGQIDADADYDHQLCEMCAAYRAKGFPLSAKLCERCEVNK